MKASPLVRGNISKVKSDGKIDLQTVSENLKHGLRVTLYQMVFARITFGLKFHDAGSFSVVVARTE